MKPPDPITRLSAALEGRYRIERQPGYGRIVVLARLRRLGQNHLNLKRSLMWRWFPILVVVFAFAPVRGGAQVIPTEELAARVLELEARIAELESLVVALQQQMRAGPTLGVAPSNGAWRDRGNWRRLRIGMTMDQVAALLGDAHRVEVTPVFTYWRWGETLGPRVYFAISSGGLLGWREPG